MTGSKTKKGKPNLSKRKRGERKRAPRKVRPLGEAQLHLARKSGKRGKNSGTNSQKEEKAPTPRKKKKKKKRPSSQGSTPRNRLKQNDCWGGNQEVVSKRGGKKDNTFPLWKKGRKRGSAAP